jgi:hypothetical protein
MDLLWIYLGGLSATGVVSGLLTDLSDPDQVVGAAFATVIWPVFLPIMIGAWVRRRFL